MTVVTDEAVVLRGMRGDPEPPLPLAGTGSSSDAKIYLTPGRVGSISGTGPVGAPWLACGFAVQQFLITGNDTLGAADESKRPLSV